MQRERAIKHIGTVKAENAKNVNSVVCEDESAPWVSPETMKPPPKASELIWKDHLTHFGLSSLHVKAFPLDAVNAVESKMDAVVIQPTGSGKSLCYQLPALFDNTCFTVVIDLMQKWLPLNYSFVHI